ncbi:MAG: 4-hydroxy-3-methylbut-2-enyl diphosphate reductase [Abditibacteriota bacterium]|nr:4-hydroxy-3-methylbut-2-enyl diphosphate reductase [Abditibacteriota bacterium]
MMEVIICKYAGFCFGVERAMKLTMSTLENNTDAKISTFGPLIHNPQVVKMLETKGVTEIRSIDDASGTDILIMPSHGAPKDLFQKCRDKNIRITDATCPFVRDVQNKVKDFISKKLQVVIIGDAAHTEIKGVVSWADNDCIVIGSEEDIEKYDFSGKEVGIVSQTTNNEDYFEKLANAIVRRAKKAVVQNTICSATHNRQESAIALAKETECMVIIGGKNSANTKRLYQLCKEANPRSYHIETADELKREWFAGAKKAGLTAGASTPAWIISSIAEKIKNF